MNNIWMDLELREDIDDFITLVFALENKYPVSVVSIDNPCLSELGLLNSTLKKFNSSASVVMTGEITEYPDGKGVNVSLISNIDITTDFSAVPLSDFISDFDMSGYTVFCGGSLKTLSELTERFDTNSFDAIIQGGFASYKVVGEENTLKKFKGRDKVPTWNLNLDLESTKKVLASGIRAKFVSKNICHNSFVYKDKLVNKNTAFNSALNKYFYRNNTDKKCMHDLLAFFTIDKSLVEFKPVSLNFTNDKIPKWWSELDSESSFSISVSCDYDEFNNLIKAL